ncbi:MAG: hypothetical protein ACSLFQ_12320, partial [Thermoanaerobaculia bacterium]
DGVAVAASRSGSSAVSSRDGVLPSLQLNAARGGTIAGRFARHIEEEVMAKGNNARKKETKKPKKDKKDKK